MPMIQPVDSSVLLNAFRAGRDDRSEMDRRAAQQRDAELKRERQGKIDGLVGQLFGAPQPTVESQFAPSAPTAAPGGIQPVNPDAAAPTMTAPPRQPNPDVLRQLVMLDPETGGKYVEAFKKMDEGDIKRLEVRNMAMGAAAHWLAKMPEAERRANFPIVAQQLIEAGWKPEELQQANLTDRGLQAYQWQSMDLDKIIDNELAEREFRMGKTVPVTAGGSVASIRPQMDAQGNVTGTTQEYIIGGGAQSAPSGIPPEAITALRRGEGSPAQFDAIFGAGAADRILGGGGGNATGGF